MNPTIPTNSTMLAHSAVAMATCVTRTSLGHLFHITDQQPQNPAALVIIISFDQPLNCYYQLPLMLTVLLHVA